MNTLQPLSQISKIEVSFVTAEIGGFQFGLQDQYDSTRKMRYADLVKGLTIQKYGSGAVNQYTLELEYLITPGSDPNAVDMVLSKATDRSILFTYGDLNQTTNAYKKEKGIISNIAPHVDYTNSKISYTITATSATQLNYATKRTYRGTTDRPSEVILQVLADQNNGLMDLLPGMADLQLVTSRGWVPTNDLAVKINEKTMAPMDYILYLVSLMRDGSGNFFFLKVFDSIYSKDGLTLPHFEIQSTASKSATNKMFTLTLGYPSSVPVFAFEVQENISNALLAEYRGNIESGVFRDYSFNGDEIIKNFYRADVMGGEPSENKKLWWEKMTSFPLSAKLTTAGLYIPAEIVQSIYIDAYFFGKRYHHSGEYLILEQNDTINTGGYRTTLSLLRVKNSV